MRVFFDSCTSPVLANTLNALIEPDGGFARHIRFMDDLGLRHDTPDVDWITTLGNDGGDWIVVTADQRIRKNLAERTAWIRAGLRGFVLAAAFQDMPMNQAASRLLWRWPEMVSYIKLSAAGSMFEVSFNRNAGFKSLAVG